MKGAFPSPSRNAERAKARKRSQDGPSGFLVFASDFRVFVLSCFRDPLRVGCRVRAGTHVLSHPPARRPMARFTDIDPRLTRSFGKCVRVASQQEDRQENIHSSGTPADLPLSKYRAEFQARSASRRLPRRLLWLRHPDNSPNTSCEVDHQLRRIVGATRGSKRGRGAVADENVEIRHPTYPFRASSEIRVRDVLHRESTNSSSLFPAVWNYRNALGFFPETAEWRRGTRTSAASTARKSWINPFRSGRSYRAGGPTHATEDDSIPAGIKTQVGAGEWAAARGGVVQISGWKLQEKYDTLVHVVVVPRRGSAIVDFGNAKFEKNGQQWRRPLKNPTGAWMGRRPLQRSSPVVSSWWRAT